MYLLPEFGNWGFLVAWFERPSHNKASDARDFTRLGASNRMATYPGIGYNGCEVLHWDYLHDDYHFDRSSE
jgi:hypothetical protein